MFFRQKWKKTHRLSTQEEQQAQDRHYTTATSWKHETRKPGLRRRGKIMYSTSTTPTMLETQSWMEFHQRNHSAAYEQSCQNETLLRRIRRRFWKVQRSF